VVRDETTADQGATVGRGISWSREAFEVAYRNHSGAVYAAAQGFCGAKVAGDVTVDVFLHLWRNPEQQDSAPASMRTSLLTMTRDVAVDTIRPETVRHASDGRPAARPGADSHEPERFPVATEERSPVAPMLQAMSRDERDSIVTAYYGGCTYREAAVVLGLDEGTVKSRIRGGLHHLQIALAHRSSSAYPDIGGDDPHTAPMPDEGLGEVLDARQVVAQAQGIIMERDSCSADEAYGALVQWSDQIGVSLPDCAEAVVSSAHDGIATTDSVGP